MVFFFLQRELFPALVSALKPGGHLIYKTYTTEQQRFSGGPTHPMFLLQPNELLHAFSSLRILHYHETVEEKGVAELVARK
jgi:tellurite methyltransferase